MPRRIRSKVSALVFSALLLGGCETLVPALTSFALSIGQDLIAAASVNHAPRYAHQMEALLIALARQATGMQFQPTLADSNYQPPPPKYLERQDRNVYSNDTYSSDEPYQQGDPYDEYEDAYAQSDDPYALGDTSEGQEEDPYSQSDNPYGQADDPYAQADDPYEQSDDPYAGANEYRDISGVESQRAARQPIQLDVAILTQRAGGSRLVPIEDGEVLRDGGDDPASGDLLKVHFSTNCVCYVYVIGVDATGYVAQIYPDVSENHQNPIAPETPYLVPGGENWWAMDAFKGVEQVFFVASHTARPDIESILSEMASIPRTANPGDYRPVVEATLLQATRGLVKVTAKPTTVGGVAGSSFTPTAFLASADDTDVVVTRWFRHQ